MFGGSLLPKKLLRDVLILFSTQLLACVIASAQAPTPSPTPKTINSTTVEILFKSYDGFDMRGKLTLPDTPGRHAVLIYVQTVEGMTVDMKRNGGRNGTFNYFDLYRDKLPEMNIGFFSYEGRGISMGPDTKRYEKIDWDVYNTSTLDNKVRDILSAVDLVRKQKGVDRAQIFLIGASEGTLLAAEAAAKAPREIKGLVLYGVLTSNMRENYKYIVSDGTFVSHLGYFDINHDGRISKEEFDKDPRGLRKRMPGVGFDVFDKNGDGFYTLEDLREAVAPLIKAADAPDYEILNAWLKVHAGVSTPKDWFKDHFAHKPIWTFLSQIDMPVGCFQGALDIAVPIEGVRQMEAEAKKEGKKKMEFFYFPDLDHSLDIGTYFYNGKIPAGHTAIFDFLKRHVKRTS